MRLWASSGGSSGTSSSFSRALRALLRRRNQRKVSADIAATLPMLTPTPTPTCTDVLEWPAAAGEGEDEDDGEDGVDDVRVVEADPEVEVDAALSVVAGTASAEEIAGPMFRKLLGSWQHWPLASLSQQNEFVDDVLQGNTSG